MCFNPLKNMGFSKPETLTYNILCKLNPKSMSFDGMIEILKQSNRYKFNIYQVLCRV